MFFVVPSNSVKEVMLHLYMINVNVRLNALSLEGLRGWGVTLTPSGFFQVTQKQVEIFQRHFSYS